MQTKAFAIIAAALLAISLGWTAAGNSQEGQGKAVCRQSVLKLDQLTVETLPAFQTVSALMDKKWEQMNLTEKKLYVRAMAKMVAGMTEGFEILTLRRVNSCPQHDSEKVWAGFTEEHISKEKNILTWSQIHLAIESLD
jgi:hypothetical protein